MSDAQSVVIPDVEPVDTLADADADLLANLPTIEEIAAEINGRDDNA